MKGVAMNLQITSRKFKAHDELKDFINKQIRSLEKYSDQILETNVILSFTHLKDSIKTAEIVTKVPGKVISVTESSEDFHKSTSIAVEKIIRQLKKVKTKRLAAKR